jgi:hypothetical protein
MFTGHVLIIEMRSYLLKPGSVKAVEDRFRDHLRYRTPLSPLGGLWHTLTGQLNTVIHIWPYADIAERDAIRAAMIQPPKWPPPLRDFLVEMHSRILLPAAFSPAIEPARHGNLYEFCIDSYSPGGVADCEAMWKSTLAARTRLSPLVFCGTSDIGGLNQWVHVWAYRDAAHREQVHAQIAGEASWSSRGARDRLLREESFLAAPAECSPLN